MCYTVCFPHIFCEMLLLIWLEPRMQISSACLEVTVCGCFLFYTRSRKYVNQKGGNFPQNVSRDNSN